MNKSTRFLGVAVVGVAALLLPLNAHAVCGASLSFGAYYSNVLTSNGPDLRSSFWILGQGNPTTGAGMDNGSVGETDTWVIPYAGGPIVQTNWAAQANYDGCPDPAVPPASARQAIAFSDLVGGASVFAAACVARDNQAGMEFNYDLPPGCAGGACIDYTLVPVPKAFISATARTGNEVQITVAAPGTSPGDPGFAPGFRSDGSVGCELNTVIPQYDVYKQQIGRDVAPSSSRDAGSTWTLVGTGNAGAPFVFTTTCGAVNCDVFVAIAPKFANGFSTGEPATGGANRVGVNSTKLHAGPTLAVTPKTRVIENKKIAQ